MSIEGNFDFDFDFSGTNRTELLSEALHVVSALNAELGGDTQAADPTMEAASRLLTQLNEEIAEFSVYPDVLELKERHFTEHRLAVPARFKSLSEQYKFYWIHFPITLRPLESMPFNKLKCGVEFNPGIEEGHLRPRAHMILPDKKFKQILEVNNKLELRIGENFEFEAASGDLSAQIAQASVKAQAGVEARAVSRLGLIAGPFTYHLKKALLDHNQPGSEKVFWMLSGAEFFQEDDPTLIVVLQVPRKVKQVKVAAALQAYHQFNLGTVGLVHIIDYFRERLATFFRKGAPVSDEKVWDITPSL